jgi:hypothetical protein
MTRTAKITKEEYEKVVVRIKMLRCSAKGCCFALGGRLTAF